MDGITSQHAFAVRLIATFDWELIRIGVIVLHEGIDHWLSKLFVIVSEESPLNDLKALLVGGRLPDAVHATEDMLDALKCELATFSSRLHIALWK